MPFEYNTPATFPRLIQAPHSSDQRPLSAGPRCPSHAPSLPAPSRAFRSMSLSSTTSSAPKTAAKGPRPSALGTASPCLAAQPRHLQGTSSPVASSILREISGSGTDRTHGLRPDSPVPPRVLLGDPRGPPAHLGCLQQVWDTMGPTLRARIGSISREDVEATLAHAPAAAKVGDPARSAADAARPNHATTAGKGGLLRLHSRRPLGPPPSPRHPAALHRRGNGHGRTPPPGVRLQHRGRLSTAFPPGAATRSAAPAASVPFPTVPQRRPTPAPAALQHQAPATFTGLTAPSAAPAAGNPMPPPPPPTTRAPFTTAAPWSVVAARHRRQPPPPRRDDRYLDLRLSKLMFVSKLFPTNVRKPVKELATHINAAFCSKRGQVRRALCRPAGYPGGHSLMRLFVDDIIRLRDLLDTAYATPDGAEWVRDVLRQATASRRPTRTTCSGSDTSFSAGPRRRDEPSSGRGNSKRASLTETSDSDDRQPRGRHHPDKRQVTARIHHATDDDSDAPPFPPRVFRYRNSSRRPHTRVATPRADCAAPVTNDFLPLQKIVEAATAAAIAAVDHHLAHLGLTLRPETTPLHGTVHHSRSHATSRPDTTSSHGTVHYSRSHAVPRLETVSLPDTVHHLCSHAIPRSDTAPSHDTALHRPHAVPRPKTASLHDTVAHYRSRAIPAPLAPLAPPTGLVVPTTEPSAIPTRASCPPGGSAAVADPSGVTPTHNGYPFAPLVRTPAPLQSPAPTAHPAISIAPAPAGPFTHGPPDERTLCDDSPSQMSGNLSPSGLRADFVAHMQAAYRTLDMRRVPRIQPLQFPRSADRTAATQLLIRSMRDALSGIFDVADPTGTMTMDSPVWVSGWHAPLLKLTKAAINANRDDTHDLYRLVDDLFLQIQERPSSGSGGPAAFKTLLTDLTDYFDRAPRGAALETLQKFGVRTGTPFSSYPRALRVVVASTVEKGGPLAPSATMAIELVRIRTAQQYPMLMPTLFPGDRTTREQPYASLALMWTAFADRKHNTSPAINGDAFASAPQVPSSHAPPPINAPTASVIASQRHSSRPSRPSHTVSNVSPVHSRRDPFRIDYGIWPFDDQDYAIVCTVTNHALHTKLSLWTPLLTEVARVRHAYSIAAAAATAVLPIIAFGGALHPSPTYFPF